MMAASPRHPMEDDELERISKSQRKRDMDRLQALGEHLLRLKPSLRATLPLSDSLHQALTDDARIKSGEAKRRHRQYLGKLMRQIDESALLDALEALQPHPGRDLLLNNSIDRLLQEGDRAVQELIQRLPMLDRHYLRLLVRLTEQEKELDGDEHTGRERIRLYLRELMLLKN